MFDKLEEAFDLMPMPKKEEVVSEIQIINPSQTEDEEAFADKQDRLLARETFKKMIFKSENMLSALMLIAEDSEHPRAFEVAANLVKTITDVAGKLDEAASKRIKTKEVETPQSSVNHNHLYVGSSEELMKMIRNNNT